MKKVLNFRGMLRIILPLLAFSAFGQGQSAQDDMPKDFVPIHYQQEGLFLQPHPFNGIYVTKEDLQSNKITDLSKSDELNNLIVDLDSKVILIRQGAEHKFKFGTLSGFYKDGYKYRAYGSVKPFATFGYYKILDDTGLIIYAKKSVNHKSGMRTWYYYSKGLDSSIHRFTKQNLQKDFAQNPAFVTAAVEAFHNNTFLDERDGHAYINELYLSQVMNHRP